MCHINLSHLCFVTAQCPRPACNSLLPVFDHHCVWTVYTHVCKQCDPMSCSVQYVIISCNLLLLMFFGQCTLNARCCFVLIENYIRKLWRAMTIFRFGKLSMNQNQKVFPQMHYHIFCFPRSSPCSCEHFFFHFCCALQSGTIVSINSTFKSQTNLLAE